MSVSVILLVILLFGLGKLVVDSYRSVRAGRYALDYIALSAMALSLYTEAYLAGAVIAVMFVGGQALERYATNRAHNALKRLGETIPKTCFIARDEALVEMPIQKVTEGEIILVKRGEIVPLDGIITSPERGVFNMANLTGEVSPVELGKGTFVKSGSINEGETLRLSVVGDFSSSTYRRIVGLVDEAKAHPAPTVRISERASIYFTVLTFVIAAAAYTASGDITRLLAVLVIATPCPLIIAAPAAFVSGMSRAARAGIIIRKPAALEGIENASVVFFDKTGTLTLGEPVLSAAVSDETLALAAGLEIHSLHPLARTIVSEARRRGISFVISKDVKEESGKGISGVIGGERYRFSGTSLSKGGVEIARFHFDDVLKEGAGALIARLERRGLRTAIITGDKKENAEKLFGRAGIEIHASQSPEDKYRLVEAEQQNGEIVVMVGDGLNDAPALAKADVGIVFSGMENGAAIEAADAAILGSGLEKLENLFEISRHTMTVARQSIYGGIGLSAIGMGLAAFGYIEPVTGALLQECIDIVVIANALRALRA
jgi:heavy metal-(Cd/Co/Hg/Pb/Zn)-translocating P-type ATPase